MRLVVEVEDERVVEAKWEATELQNVTVSRVRHRDDPERPLAVRGGDVLVDHHVETRRVQPGHEAVNRGSVRGAAQGRPDAVEPASSSG